MRGWISTLWILTWYGSFNQTEPFQYQAYLFMFLMYLLIDAHLEPYALAVC